MSGGREREDVVHPILRRLEGGDRRSTGAADEVARVIAGNADLFAVVFEGMLVEDAVVRMRAADAIEKATRDRPGLLQAYKGRLLDQVAGIEQQGVRWHLAQMIARLVLDDAERATAVALLERFLDDESRIVQVNAMQALVDLTVGDPALRRKAIPVLRRLVEGGSPAVKARGRKLLEQIGDQA